MKAILIDPYSETITEVSYDGDWKSIGPLIGADYFDVVYIDKEDTVYVDDEGLLQQNRKFFWMKGFSHPLCGKGLVLGLDPWGDTKDSKHTVEDLRKEIKFMDDLTVNLLVKTGVFK